MHNFKRIITISEENVPSSFNYNVYLTWPKLALTRSLAADQNSDYKNPILPFNCKKVWIMKLIAIIAFLFFFLSRRRPRMDRLPTNSSSPEIWINTSGRSWSRKGTPGWPIGSCSSLENIPMKASFLPSVQVQNFFF